MTTGLLTPTHLLILLVVLVLLFGAKRLPETGRALGRGMHDFKEAVTGRAESLSDATTYQPKTDHQPLRRD